MKFAVTFEMRNNHWLFCLLATAAAIGPAGDPAIGQKSTAVTGSADMPIVEFRLTSRPSDLVVGNPQLAVLSRQMRDYVEDILQKHAVTDAAIKVRLLSA
jgi:hypothetical protein